MCPLPEFWGKGECGGYGEFVIETDHHVGRVLEFLKESGLDDDTMIVFTSDNGPERSWQQRIGDFGHASNAIYRGGKRDIYEGGHRVPFFVRWPGGIKEPGRTFDQLVGQTDLMATFADIIGVSLPENAGEDSQSFAAVLLDPAANHQRLPLINHGSGGRFAVTEGNWKLIMAHKKLSLELYDLSADPGETRNVLDQNPKIAEDLKSKISRIVSRGRSTDGPAQSNDTGYWDDLTWMTESDYMRD